MRALQAALLLLTLFALPSCAPAPLVQRPAIPDALLTPPPVPIEPDAAALSGPGWDRAVGYYIADLRAALDTAVDRMSRARVLNGETK